MFPDIGCQGTPTGPIARERSSVLLSAAKNIPAVVLTGPRRAGKITLLRRALFAASHQLFGAPDVVARFRADPRGFLSSLRPPAILDEIQNEITRSRKRSSTAGSAASSTASAIRRASRSTSPCRWATAARAGSRSRRRRRRDRPWQIRCAACSPTAVSGERDGRTTSSSSCTRSRARRPSRPHSRRESKRSTGAASHARGSAEEPSQRGAPRKRRSNPYMSCVSARGSASSARAIATRRGA